jgi:prepilin-type processing-associated H-X9-DG protein
MQCSNKLKQLTLALHTFHDVHNRLPASSFDPVVIEQRLMGAGFLGLLLPFIEQNALYEVAFQRSVQGAGANNNTNRHMRDRPAVRTLVDAFLCPSDSGQSRFGEATAFPGNQQMAFTNYRGSRGDLAGNDTDGDRYGRDPWHADSIARNNSVNDFFRTSDHLNMPRSWLRVGTFNGGFEIVTSGTSNTIALSEGVIGIAGVNGGDTTANTGGGYREVIANGISSHYNQIPQNCLNVKGASGEFGSATQSTQASNHWMGRRAYGNYPGATQFYTLLPPNSPSCRSGWHFAWISASSYHTGGVNASFIDGSVRFVNNSIDTRNLNRRVTAQVPDNPPAEPFDASGGFSYGVWAELGAANSAQSVSL